MKGTIFLTVSALVYTISTTILFFKKNTINKLENRIFKRLLVMTILSMVFELMIIPVNEISGLNTLIPRFFFVCILLWLAIFFIYSFAVTVFDDNIEEEKSIIKYKNIHIAFIIINFIPCILTFVLPMEFISEGDNKFINGPAVNVLFVTLAVYLIVMIILVLTHIKKIHKKGYIPIISLIILLILEGIIQNVHPEMLLANGVFGFIIYLMYHTIENPDMKLLEELHKSKEISDNANEEKTLFIYNLTQDIRNISGAIDDDADYISDSKNWDETYECARNIKFNSAKFTTMTNEILDISQVDSSSIKTFNSKYNIKNVLKQVINVYNDLCNNKELEFRTNIDHTVPELLYGDGIGLKDVLTTILNNSVKYTNKGFVELSVNTIIKGDICRLIITVEDSGVGIKSEDINNIKIDNKSLSKANKLVTLMKGAMLISSDLGVGTKVKIILDQKIEHVENIDTAKYEEILDNIKILAVDDSEAGLKIIEKLLKGSKAELTKASNGKECIDKIKTGKYDLILLDEELSQITANELIVKIKEIRNFETPVILLTKDNSYDYNEEYVKNGFSGYILKPLKKEQLLEEINKYIE